MLLLNNRSKRQVDTGSRHFLGGGQTVQSVALCGVFHYQ